MNDLMTKLIGTGRKAGVWVAILLIAACPLGCWLYLSLNWPETHPDQVALVGVVATVAAAYLAFLAAVVALLAFLLADRSPQIAVELNGKALKKGFKLELNGELGGGLSILAPATLDFVLVNSAAFSARNPIVIVVATGAGLSNVGGPWTSVPTTPGDKQVFQWNGGANVSIHGFKSSYPIPIFAVAGNNSWATAAMTMTIEVQTDGFRLPPRPVPIQIAHVVAAQA